MKNRTKLLSIVIPCFNMENYLEDCLNSITADKVPSSVEIIIINDGSTDESQTILKKFEKKRPDIITIIEKENGHYGSCINIGLKIATGTYFRILDADDWFSTTEFVEFLEKIKYIDVDLILNPRSEHRNNDIIVYNIHSFGQGIQPKAALQDIPYDELQNVLSMHSMTYRRSFLQEINLALQEGISYTDTEFYLLPLNYIKTFCYLDYNIYQYRLGREGQSMDLNVFKKNRHQLFMVITRILGESIVTTNSIIYRRLLSLLQTYYGMLLFEISLTSSDQEDMTNLYKKIHEKAPTLWRDLNKKLFFIPSFWKKTTINFYFYTRIKKFFGIKKLFDYV